MGTNLQGNVVSAPPGTKCTPQSEQGSIFSGNLGGLDGGSVQKVSYNDAYGSDCIYVSTMRRHRFPKSDIDFGIMHA